jgi:hypothetical protein
MGDKNIIIGHVINVTGMIGVSSGVLLFTFGIVLLVFRHGFGIDIPNSFHRFW